MREPKPRAAPIGLRLPDEVRNRVAELATREQRNFHAQLVRLIELGLDAEEQAYRRAEAKAAAPKESRKEPPGEGPRRSGVRMTAGAAKGMCVHRVPLDSFCPRCGT